MLIKIDFESRTIEGDQFVYRYCVMRSEIEWLLQRSNVINIKVLENPS